MKKIKSALISVFHKDGLEPILEVLNKNDVTIYSTGGTYKFIEENGYAVEAVEDLTTYPSILGGRVKTLHPKVFGGILSRRSFDSDVAQLDEYDIPEIDLVIVDLYPFEETVKNKIDKLLTKSVPVKHEQLMKLKNRLLKYRHYITTCLYHIDVPSDNNGSERALRNAKVKQKISGHFKTLNGLEIYAIIRSVIDTLIKQKLNIFEHMTLSAKIYPE